MMKIRYTLAFVCIYAAFTGGAGSQTIVAGKIIRSRSIISASDLAVQAQNTPGAFRKIGQVAGMEARSILYPGRPILTTDVGPPTVIRRNEVVMLIYQRGALLISTEGRALAPGSIGDKVRVMNLSSRTTVSGIVTRPGEIRIMQ